MRGSITAERVGLFQALTRDLALLLGSDDQIDEVTLDAFRGFRDPEEEAQRIQRTSFKRARRNFRPI